MNKAFKSSEAREAVLGYYEQMMGLLSVPHEHVFVDTCCGRTSMIACGDRENPPLILLHGSSMNAAMWIGDLPKYAAHFRVYAPDLPGESGYSDERQPAFDADDYGNWLADAMDGLGIQRASIVGASLGGFVALKFAVAHPGRATKLALLCPAGIGGQNHAFKDVAMRLLPQGEAGVDELLRQVNGGNEVPEVMLNYMKLIAFCFNARQEPIPVFSDAELGRLGMPGIVFVGTKDIMLRSDETAERVRRLMPGFEVVEIEGAGHSLAGVGGDVARFLERA